MDNVNENLPDKIKTHLDSLTKASGLPYNEDSIRLITTNWLEKKEMFEEQIKSLDMIEVESFKKEDKRGVLLLTYSGSLISVSPYIGKGRHIEYSSIKLRSDVPEIVIMDDTDFNEDVNIDKGIAFESGPIKTTSSLFKITTCKEDVSIEEQEKRIKEATIFLTNAFVKLNRNTFVKDEDIPDQFNLKSMIKYIAEKNGITQKLAKEIIEDYLYMVECGMLLGERPSLGRIGNSFLKKREAQKARIGVNPSTGEKITINAKPEMYVPKMNFSKAIKEKSATVNIKGVDDKTDQDDDED